MDDHSLVSRIDEAAGRIAGRHARDVNGPRARLAEWRARERDIEFKCALKDAFAQGVFLSLCAVYGLRPYRVPRQRISDACIRAPRSFVREVFWPQFEAIAKVFEGEFVATTHRVMELWSGESLDQLGDSIEPDEGPR